MKERLTISLDKNLIERLQKMAEDEQRSLSGLINRLLTKAVEPTEKGGRP